MKFFFVCELFSSSVASMFFIHLAICFTSLVSFTGSYTEGEPLSEEFFSLIMPYTKQWECIKILQFAWKIFTVNKCLWSVV